MRRLLLLAVLACLTVPAAAEDAFPFDSFRATTLKQLLTDEAADTERDQYSTPGSSTLRPPVRVKVAATYTGKHREMTASTAKFIRRYGVTNPNYVSWAASFDEEWQFVAEGKTWWFPVQKLVAEYFPQELHSGDKIEIYAVYLGVQWLDKGYDTIIVLEEFQ